MDQQDSQDCPNSYPVHPVHPCEVKLCMARAIIPPMLDEKDIEKLVQVLATRAELEAAVSNLATKEDISVLLNSIDAYAK